MNSISWDAIKHFVASQHMYSHSFPLELESRCYFLVPVVFDFLLGHNIMTRESIGCGQDLHSIVLWWFMISPYAA